MLYGPKKITKFISRIFGASAHMYAYVYVHVYIYSTNTYHYDRLLHTQDTTQQVWPLAALTYSRVGRPVSVCNTSPAAYIILALGAPRASASTSLVRP